jgi:hypothetical protein
VLGLQGDPNVDWRLLRDLDARPEGDRRRRSSARCESDPRADSQERAH